MTKLKKLREKKGITQRELAELLGIPLRTIIGYEQKQRDINKASCSTVKKIADALNVKIEDLLEGEK